MAKNNYSIVLPFSAVRFSVLIAQDKKNIDEITKWVRRLSSKKDKTYSKKLYQYLINPAKRMVALYDTGQGNKADKILSDWLAFDIYPEYRTERSETMMFLIDIAEKGLNYNK